MSSFILSVAPMMDWTDRHFRYFMRILAPHAVLYTEMITAKAILFGDVKKLLSFHEKEHPLVLQLGGRDAAEMSEAVNIAEDFGYDGYNINVGCPSDRVQGGSFGACLMKEPNVVASCVHEMSRKTNKPISVKTRLGVDDLDSQEALHTFIQTVHDAGCTHFILHARKAWLQGLSPKENRTIPPLDYDRVYNVKNKSPHLKIEINGGLRTVQDIEKVSPHVDGVMIGRAAYEMPYTMTEIHHHLYGGPAPVLREKILEDFMPYIEGQMSEGVKLLSMARHIMGLYHGCYGGKRWRRFLSEECWKEGAGPDILYRSLQYVQK